MKNKNWFVWAADNEFETYLTQAEAVAAAKLLIPKYLVDGVWDDGVDEIKVGCFTHETIEIDRVDRPDLDKDGCDREGDSCGNLEFKCNYKLVSNSLVVMNTGGYIDIINPLDVSDREIAIKLATSINDKSDDNFYKNAELERIAAIDRLILEGKLDLSKINRDRDGESNA
jgi:hypothetical protein